MLLESERSTESALHWLHRVPGSRGQTMQTFQATPPFLVVAARVGIVADVFMCALVPVPGFRRTAPGLRCKSGGGGMGAP